MVEAIVCLSQRLELDLIFDTEHVAFECKSILIVSASDRVKRSLWGICMYECVGGARTGTRNKKENYSDRLYYLPIHLHQGFVPLRVI